MSVTNSLLFKEKRKKKKKEPCLIEIDFPLFKAGTFRRWTARSRGNIREGKQSFFFFFFSIHRNRSVVTCLRELHVLIYSAVMARNIINPCALRFDIINIHGID